MDNNLRHPHDKMVQSFLSKQPSLWDRGLAGARSLAGPQRGRELLWSAAGSVPGSRGFSGGPGGQPTAQGAAVCSAGTGHLLGLAPLGLTRQWFPEGAAPALGEALGEEPGALAGAAGGAGSQLCSLPRAGVAPHPAREGGKAAVGSGPKALPGAHGKLKDNAEQSCNCSSRHRGRKSFPTAPDYCWEG